MADLTPLLKVDEQSLLAVIRRRSVGTEVEFASLDIGIKFADYSTEELIAAARAVQKGLYETDDRVDIYDLTDEASRADSESVVAIFLSHQLTKNMDGSVDIATAKYGDKFGLCSCERFYSQPVAAFCSGVLVTPNIIATAGHCINSENVKNARFVFGFRMADAENPLLRVPAKNVFSGVAMLGWKAVEGGSDWALIKLDRASNRKPAEIRTSGKIGHNEKVHVIGHPSGLPLKFAGNAAVRNNDKQEYFVANLDTYGGNSGSPVFNSVTHVVEGLLVRGDTDFVKTDNGCKKSMVCPTTGCQGEDCTRTTEFSELLVKSLSGNH